MIRTTLLLPVASILVASTAPADTAPLEWPQAAAEIGITPTALVLAGASNAEAEGILSRISAENELRASLSSLHEQEIDAAAQATHLYQDVLTSEASETISSQLQTLQTSLTNIRNQLQQVRMNLRAAAFASVSTSVVSRLEIAIDGLAYNASPSFAAVQRTDDQWRHIGMALRAEARAQRLAESLDATSAQLLEQIRADSTVAAAQQALILHLAEMEQTFATFEPNSP